MSEGPITVVLNPSASDWEARERWPQIDRLMNAAGLEHDVVETGPGAGEAVQAARSAVERGCSRIVSVGGDGTVSAVINGIMTADVESRPALSLVPLGTANDIARSFNLRPGDLEQSVGAMVEGLDYPLDLGLLDGDRYFADAFTVGYDASVLLDRSLTRRQRLLLKKGLMSYLPSLVKESFLFRKAGVNLTLDGDALSSRIYNLVIKNTSVYAGSFVLNRKIRANDGRLDVFLFSRGSEYWSEVGSQLIKQFSGATDPTGLGMDLFDMIVKNYKDYQASDIDMSMSEHVQSQVDGEIYRAGDHYHVRCVKAALTIRVPSPY